MHNFPRPTTPTVAVEREAVAGSCPQCQGQRLAGYPVLSENGWWQVVKCQDCLASLSRERGPLFGVFAPLTNTLEFE